MGYKLSYRLYIGKWVFPSHETLTIYPYHIPFSRDLIIYPSHETLTIYPSHETLTIYPQRGSLLCSLLTRPLLYTHQPRPHTRDPNYIPPPETPNPNP